MCVFQVSGWRVKSSALTVGQMEAPVRLRALKILVIFGHIDKSNTYFESVYLCVLTITTKRAFVK